MSSQTKSGYNFQNVSINYRYGLEQSGPIDGFNRPVNQKEINFALLGKKVEGLNLGLTRSVVEPLFEEYDQVDLINEGIYDQYDPDIIRYVETRKFLRLTGLNILNAGDGYTANDPVELTFSNLSDPRVSGGVGIMYDEPILNIVTSNGGLGSFSIQDGGRFEGSYEINAFSGESVDYSRTGTGFFGTQLSTPVGGWEYNSGVYTGTGTINYNEFSGGVNVYPSGTSTTGTFSGNVADANPDTFYGVFEGANGASIQIALSVNDDDEFIFNESGKYYIQNSLIFSETGVEPTYIATASNPDKLGKQDDIRDGTNYSNWNLLQEEPSDKQVYTHIIQNSNVDSVSAVFNIKQLNDTLHKADSVFEVTDKPGLFGGDLKVDAAFRIGNPTDSFVTLKVEWGFLNTELIAFSNYTYNGQTINGYLVETPKLSFNSYKELQQLDPKYQNFTIKQLKYLYPKFIKVSKDMYETDSSLINRDVILDSIKEHFDTKLNYPSSAIVATNIESTYFDSIPKRTYDAKLKKVWVPETYNIDHRIEDKRFREDDINLNNQVLLFGDTRVSNKYSRLSGINYRFGDTIAINNGTLFICDDRWGNGIIGSESLHNEGQIFVYKDMGKGDEDDFQMIRDGTTRSTDLALISAGANFNLPDFDITNGDAVGNLNDSLLQTVERVLFITRIAIIGISRIKYAYAGLPLSATHSLFLKISPKKAAILRASIAFNAPPSGDYRDLIKEATAIVVGEVANPYQLFPDEIHRIVYSGGLLSSEETGIVNQSETDPIWVKFFSAQIRQILIRIVITPYGVIEFAYLGGFIPPYYDSAGAHPYQANITSVTLTDESMKNYRIFDYPEVSKSQNEYFVHTMHKTTTSEHLLVIFKLDKNGLWYPFQEIIKHSSSGNAVEAYSLSFFPSQNRFVVIWKNITDIEIYSLNSQGLFELEYSFPDFVGVFEGFLVHTLRVNRASYCSVVNQNTIAISRNCSVAETAATENELRDFNGLVHNTFIYKRDQNGVWGLAEIIKIPQFKKLITPFDADRIDTAGDWLIIGGRDYDADPYSSSRDIGAVFLYRYNGKKYEFIKTFASDAVKDLDIEGNPDFTNYDTYFGDFIALNLDENNEPVIVASASREEDLNTEGYIYVFKRNPHSDEWIHEKVNPFNGWVPVKDSRASVPRLAFDGQNIAFTLESRTNSSPDSVGVLSVKAPEKSTRLYECKNWFGVMKKGWSDNPAWIIYDLLTNPTYGAGSALDSIKDINVFNFYEASKYFDSCDEDGFYAPIYDEKGQTEPRLSCNFLLDTDFNAFNVISSICDMFFGAVYIKEGKYNLWVDKPVSASWFFNNTDVLDGNFSYADSEKANRPSLVKVPFLDKYENFKEKIEFVEDAELMRKNGKNQYELNFATFTTRSQARRFGKHYLYNKSYETEKIKFQTDTRALFLNPGDVIGINDELKSFKNEKLFWQVKDIGHTEKVYAVSHTKNNSSLSAFTFSEITFNRASTDDFEVKYIDKESNNFNFSNFDISLDNGGVPYILGSIQNGDCSVYKRNGDDFDEVNFEEGVSYSNTNGFKSNLAFDSSNIPYFSFIEGGTTEPTIGFSKLTGSDFTNTGHWQFTSLENLDASSGNFTPQVHFKSVIRINSANEKYILTYRTDSSPQSGEYVLYYNNGISDDTNPSSWNRYSIDSFGDYQTNVNFDMQLTNDKPAIAYSKPLDQFGNFYQVRYKELIGTNLGLETDWADVFVQGADKDASDDIFHLKFDKSSIPYITHTWDKDNTRHINSPLSYAGRFSYDNWSENSKFIDYAPVLRHKMSLEFLQNGNYLIFSNNYRRQPNPSSISDTLSRSLQFEESSDEKEWGQAQNWQKKYVYKTDVLYSDNYSPNQPSTAYSFNGCTITLSNPDGYLFEDFDIDTSIQNNLEISNLSQEITGFYNETQFKDFSTKIKNDLKIKNCFVTVTGFEDNGAYISLFLEESEANSKIIQNLLIDNPIVRPVKAEEDKYKEYRVLNIIEQEANLYEVEAKEYHSGKFDIIDNFAHIIEPKEPEYNIGLPDNEVNRPPEPLGVQYQTGIDDAGSPLLTGLITGEPGGTETKYRLSLFYPNGRLVEKEIEKNTNNLSPSNEPLTNFNFYNLAVIGDYQLNVKSLRNPESSDFIDKKFTISDFKEKVNSHPFIESINLSVKEELMKISVNPKNVYGESLNLFDSNCRINVKIEEQGYVENSKLTDFEISFQQIKDLTNSYSREKKITVELVYGGVVISEKTQIIGDEPPKINNIDFISDGSSVGIVADISETEKLTSLDLRTGQKIIKTFEIKDQNRIQNFELQDFEISTLPRNQKIDFSFTPKDFYGTGQSYTCEGYIPERESVVEKYNNSMICIYSIYSESEISTGEYSYNSSNGQSGFYGNGEDCLLEFSSSLISGESANLNLEIISDEGVEPVSMKFNNQGFLSTKKILNLPNIYYNVYVSSESGLFDGFELKIKKLV